MAGATAPGAAQLRPPPPTDPRMSGWAADGSFLLAPAHERALAEAELPPGVDARAVRAGGAVFHGRGGCHVCHGEAGVGARGVGADLTDGDWWHADGSPGGIADRVRAGVPVEDARNGWGAAMPPRGGSDITDAEVRAVAAYVWSLRLFEPRREPPDTAAAPS